MKTSGIKSAFAALLLLTAAMPALGLPNLTPYKPTYYSDKIVVSRTAGNYTDSSGLTTADTLYLDWAVINNGTTAAGSFYTYLYVDGIYKAYAYTASLASGAYTYVSDYSIGSLSAGTHTIMITADATYAVTESNESDNSYTKTITVSTPSLPNLTPYLISGWSDKIVVSRTTGATTDSTSLTTADSLYVNWAVINNGSAAAGAFYVYVYVDGTYKGYGSVTSLGANNYTYWHDLTIGSLSAGTHTVMITADATYAVTESNESDNSYTKTITVGTPSLPNLTPYQPPAWSDKILVSRTTGATTDSTGLTTADALYVDWSVANIGTAATGSGFYNTLYVDGVVKTAPYYNASLGAGSYFTSTDYLIGSLSAGTHTIMIKADSGLQITESNENDNTYTKTITVSNPSLPNLTPYQPPGWSDKIVVSRTTGTTTDSTSLTTADSLYVDFGIANLGTAATAATFNTALFVDGVGKGSWATPPPLNANTYLGYNLDVPIGSLSAGTHTVMITVDYGGTITESDETDNSYTKTITVAAAAAPNLTPYQPPGWSDKIVVSRTAGVYTDSTSLTTADSLYVDWGVVNNGNAAAAGTFYTYLYVDGVLKGSWSTASLNANYYIAGFNFLIGSLSTGTHTVSITTDATSAISESNEGDNTYSKTINVGGTSLPDFLITAISLSPTSPQPGQPYTAYVTVKNQGSVSANGNWLDVWANQPTSQSCGANGDTWTSVGVLTAGQSKTLTFGMTAPASAGSYTFRAFVDSACQTTESAEGNNQSTLTYNVIQPSQLPDFLVTAISLSPASPQPGQTFTANVTVKNQGTVAGDGGWLDVWANQPSSQSCGANGNTWASVGALSAGQSKTFTLTLTASSTAGSYTFRAFVDSACQTTESAEANNQTTLAYTLVGASQPPDFIVTSITFSPTQPVGGQPFTAYVTVKNQGLGSGDGRYLDVWVNQPSSQSCGASGDQYHTVGILAAGQSITKTYNLTAPSGGAPWTFRAFVDSGCQTTESNDANNQTTVSYGANPAAQPDFLITSISLSPSNLQPGDKFTAFVTVKNQGSGPGDAGWLDVWANKPAAATCGDSGDSYSAVGILSAGQSKTITVANLTAVAGSSTLRAFVDSTCQTTESNDGNNQTTYSYVAGQRVLLLLHGMNSGPETWNDFVQTRFNNSAPVIRGGVSMSLYPPIPDANGVVCYRLAFGYYDWNSGRTGVEGTSAATDPHKDQYGGEGGDFSTFATLGTEVWDAANFILSVYPNAQITLLGHSRGGIAARAFLQQAGSSAEKASVVALLTTGTPHKGSRLGRIYQYLQDHPESSAPGNYWQADWDVANFLRGAKQWSAFPATYNLDVRRPTINDLADTSSEISSLNSLVGNLPASLKYGSITYTGADLGVLASLLFGITDYRIFDTAGYNIAYQVSSQAEDQLLGTGLSGSDYPGDGIVPVGSQSFNDLSGFPGTSYQTFPHTGGVLHTAEPGQQSHITAALNSLLPWWQ